MTVWDDVSVALAAARALTDSVDEELTSTRARVASLLADADTDHATIATLQARVAELEAQLTPGIPGAPPTGKLVWGSTCGGRTAPKVGTYGGPIGGHRTYFAANMTEIDAMVRVAKADNAAGRLPWVSFAVGDWAAMAAGAQDAFLQALRDAVAALDFPVWVTIHHEPENDPGNGTPQDWSAMQDHAGTILRDAPNLAFLPIFMYQSVTPEGWTSDGQFWRMRDLFTDVWHAIGVDQYPGRLKVVQPDIGGAPGFAVVSPECARVDRPFAMGEWAYKATTYTSSPGNPGAIGRAVDQALAVENCIGMFYFDSHQASDVAHWEFNGDVDGRLADFVSACARSETV